MHFEGRVPHDSHAARFNLSWLMAGKVYQKLKKLASQSEETIQARELIKAAVSQQ